MPGPTKVGLSRSTAVRGILTAVVVMTLVAAVAVATLVARRDPTPSRAGSGRAAVEEATLRMVPAPGTTGAATCTDPMAGQQWRVTWRAVPATSPAATASHPSAGARISNGIAHAAGAAVPTQPAAPTGSPAPSDQETPTIPASGSASASATGTANPSATLQTELTKRAAGVTLIPTGFAVRPLADGTATAGGTPAPTAPTTPANLAPPVAAGVATPSAGPTLAGGWQSRDQDRWLLRWSPTLAETVTAAPNEEWVRMGSLAVLARFRMTVQQDPRFVTPDGACSVYLAPFVSGTAGTRNAVAVIGDSLVAQLYASEDGTATGTGTLLNRLVAAGDRAEIAGQGGRRWTVKPNVPVGLEQADASMLDEIRGLREARAVVIALGTNDAGWVALAANQEQYELRMAWVLLHLAPILDEVREHGHCTVLTTLATRNKTYIDTAPGRFDAAATRINDYLRQRANADPNDRLRLWDWELHANEHGTTDPQPWFGADTIHLNKVGHLAYADELASATALC